MSEILTWISMVCNLTVYNLTTEGSPLYIEELRLR